MKKTITTFLFLTLYLYPIVRGQMSYWSETAERNIPQPDIKTTKSVFYDLQIENMRTVLESVPERIPGERQKSDFFILLPTPEGFVDTFEIFKTALMHPGLQAKYPGISTFSAIKKNNPAVIATLDITYRGVHAMVFEEGKQWFIDPVNRFDSIQYQVYYKSDFITNKKMNCLVSEEHTTLSSASPQSVDRNFRECGLRRYRTCVAATGEYTQYHGGTIQGAMSAIVTTINRVNTILRMDMAIDLQLIENNDLVIYTDGDTDPYSNENGSAMLNQNVNTLNAVIGSDNYDFGHVFSTGGGGVAYLNAVCGGSKAGGVTGSGNPENDPFDIDYVAHEMGHQMGGNHTQNNNCNRESNAAYEPGSASTIMGYAGICSPDIQNNSDPYYHVKSLEEMTAYMYYSNGNSCAEYISLFNSSPEITHIPSGLTLPISTPFELTATAHDPDGDELFFCWEQYDNEVGNNMPPLSTNSQGPVFRSLYPSSSPTRIFPAIDAIVNNQTPTWEVLPSVSRNMNFKVTVRDRVEETGCIDIASSTFNFDASAGPFLVTYPNNQGIEVSAGEEIVVMWDVANTNTGTVNTGEVDIYLSEDGGYTYPHVLALNVPNTGSSTVSMPALETDLARIKIKGRHHVFFDISDNNFSINISNATFVVQADKLFSSLCQGDSDAIVFNSQALLGYEGTISFSINTPLPSGLSAVFTEENISAGASTTLNFLYGDFNPGGTYVLEILVTDGNIERVINLTVILNGSVTSVTLVSPTYEENSILTKPSFLWTHDPNAIFYDLEISPDINFATDVLFFENISGNTFTLTVFLEELSTYYWRVIPKNSCSAGIAATIGIFQTSNCITYFSENVPITIPENLASTVSSTLTVPDNSSGNIADLDVINIFGIHTWMEDLIFTLIKDGNSVRLAEQECGSDEGFSFSFDDSAVLSVIECGLPVGKGLTYRPVENLSVFNGIDPQGEWILQIDDVFNQDGGSLANWGIKICYENSVCRPVGIPVTEGIYIADSECTDEEGWTHYYKSAAAPPETQNEVLLLSIKKDDIVEINPNQVAIGVGPETVLHLNNVQYVPNPGVWYVMSRYWEVTPSVQPGQEGCQVRFYFLEEEAEALTSTAGLVYGTGNLRTFKFETNAGIDPNPQNGHENAGEADFVLFEPSYDDFNIKLYAEFNVDGFSGGGIGAGGELPLPIDLLSFIGKEVQEGHHLIWETANADNFSRFEIESSIDGKNFRNLGTIHYNTGLSKYLFINTIIKSEITYYRLKMINQDESFTYSHIISLTLKKLGTVSVYPNPVRNLLHVKMNNRDTSKNIEIVNNLGQTIGVFTTNNQDVLDINVEHLSSGVYFLRINTDFDLQHIEFIKQ